MIPAIEIRDLSYSYRSDWLFSRISGLKGLSLEVAQGESFGFLGHNGAGKTTTIKCLLGLIRPRTGSIRIFGTDSREIGARRSVGYLPEQPYFYDHLTVREIMELYAALAGVPSAERSESIERALSLTGISSRSKAPLRSLSKGLTQRLAMAQAIVHRPRLLILDEPFSGLDPVGRKEFADLLSHLKESGTTIFMSSHILKDVEFLCGRVSILKDGVLKGVFHLDQLPAITKGQYELSLQLHDKVQELLSKAGGLAVTRGRLVRLTFQSRGEAETALKAAIDLGINIESFQFIHGGLEELFLRLVREE